MKKETKLVWSRLKSMKCPKCGSFIEEHFDREGYECVKCNMFISKERFNSLVNSLYSKPTLDLQDESVCE